MILLLFADDEIDELIKGYLDTLQTEETAQPTNTVNEGNSVLLNTPTKLQTVDVSDILGENS